MFNDALLFFTTMSNIRVNMLCALSFRNSHAKERSGYKTFTSLLPYAHTKSPTLNQIPHIIKVVEPFLGDCNLVIGKS